jgi:hypothetical protein
VENKDADRAGRRWLAKSENKLGKMAIFKPKKSWYLTKSARPQHPSSGSVHIRQLAYNQRLPLMARLRYARNQHKEKINKTISFVKKNISPNSRPKMALFVQPTSPRRAEPHAAAAAMRLPRNGHNRPSA